ncbi:MAG: penicillin-binding protein 2 [Candidatus Aminicenantes bacterium]|nr:penicillin-binding protein 2 [Candidatus Aminicenantes bacterium]
MYIEKRKLNRDDIKRLVIIINIFIVIVFAGLFFFFWNMQIIENQYYTSLANKNITKTIAVRAPRGLIRDRNGNILAENKINFGLFLIREAARDMNRSIAFAAELTGLLKNEIDRRVEMYQGHTEFYMTPIKKNLSLEKVIYVESRSGQLPEFKIENEPARTYPYKTTASHILGYLSELTEDELEKEKEKNNDYKMGDLIGKSGIEKQYERYLRGRDGNQTVVRDNLGLIHEKVAEEKPGIGHCVVLTIDIELQNFIEDLFKNYRGTAAVADLGSGEILALVSSPNFDPEFFTDTFDRETWLSLVNNPEKPLHNKFTQGQYSPGSVFKIVMALTGLQEKIIDPSTLSYCSGTVKIYGDIRRCWNSSGHGDMNIYDAIKNSCNIYFFRLGKKIDIDIIERYAGMLGLGEKTAVDLPNESRGLLPSRTWKREKRGEEWFPGDTISVAIGHGMLDVTPAQVLSLISTVALRGKKPALHLLKRIEKDGKTILQFKPHFVQLPIDKKNFEIVIEGLYRVVNSGGTGRAAAVKGLDICGKTGTGQIISKENPDYKDLLKQERFKPHSWFASFAPRDNPRIAVVVFIENGGDAGAVAAPLARKIYERVFSPGNSLQEL